MDAASSQGLNLRATLSSRKVAAWVLALALIVGAGLLIAAGPAPQLIYPSDTVTYMDACHRAFLGQWLGRDFSAPIGPAAILFTTVAMKFTGPSVTALVVGSAATWLAYGVAAWSALRHRMPAWLGVGFAVFVAGTAAAPYPLDFGDWRYLSYSILYNRLAWAALAITAAIVLLPNLSRPTTKLDPLAVGATAMWLWALKPNFLLILAPLAVLSWWQAPERSRWMFWAVLGGLACFWTIWLGVRFSPLGYVETHLGMARSASGSIHFYTFERALFENALAVAVVAWVWGVACWQSKFAHERWKLALTLSALVACTFVANLANNQYSEIPLWGALGWIACAQIARFDFKKLAPATAIVAGLTCGVAFTWQPPLSFVYSFAWKKRLIHSSQVAVEISSDAWRDLPMRPQLDVAIGAGEDLESPRNYAEWLNDGLALLRRTSQAGQNVLCLDWANPFSFATGSLPIPGDEIAWHVGRTVSVSHHPEATRLLAHAAVVMEPLRSLQPPSLAFKKELFAPTLQRDFILAGRSAHWVAWIRRVPAANASASAL